MSFINVKDERGNDMLLSLKRIDKVQLQDTGGDNDDASVRITLLPLSKDDPEEYIYSSTPVDEIWDQIKMRM